MVAQPNKLLQEAEGKLTMLLLELRCTPEFERVKLYVEKFANGKKLSEYLRDESVPVKERAMLAESLTEILLKREYDRLPELPAASNGNGGGNGNGAHKRTVAAPKVDVSANESEAPESPALDELRQMIREEVRREMAGMFEMIAKALREKD